MKKMITVVVMSLSMMTAPGCALFQKPEIQHQLLECGKDAVANLVPNFTGVILGILAGNNPNWSVELTAVLKAGGDAAACAFRVILAQLETGVQTVKMPRGQAQAVGSDVILSRAEAYAAAHGL